MTLREAFALALQFLRARQGLSQQDLAPSMAQSYVSRLEAAQRSVSLEVSSEFAEAVGLHPISFLTLVYAAQGGQSPLEILQLAESQLSAAELLDAELGSPPEGGGNRKKASAALTALAVLKLKNEGKTQAEAARELRVSTSTVGRHWHKDQQRSVK